MSDGLMEIECPACGSRYQCPRELRGSTGTCAPCGQQFEIQPIGARMQRKAGSLLDSLAHSVISRLPWRHRRNIWQRQDLTRG